METEKLRIVLATMVTIVVLGCLMLVLFSNNRDDDRFYPNELEEGVGYSICTASVRTYAYICTDDEGRVGLYDLYEVNQSSLEHIIETCPNGYFTQIQHCIGEQLRAMKNDEN